MKNPRWLGLLAALVLAGCNVVPVPVAPHGASSATATQGAVLDAGAVRDFDQAINRLAGSDAATQAALTAQYAPVFGDADLQRRVGTLLEGWVSGLEITNLRMAFARVAIQQQVANTEQERTLLQMRATRAARWQRLAARVGIAVPHAFHAFRGVRGEYAIEEVVGLWEGPAGATLPIRSRELTSWSLDREVAVRYSSDQAAAAIYEAVLPFEQTLADKWVDGGAFITLGADQQEVIATCVSDTLAVSAVTAVYRGRAYTINERAALREAWDKAHPLPVAS